MNCGSKGRDQFEAHLIHIIISTVARVEVRNGVMVEQRRIYLFHYWISFSDSSSLLVPPWQWILRSAIRLLPDLFLRRWLSSRSMRSIWRTIVVMPDNNLHSDKTNRQLPTETGIWIHDEVNIWVSQVGSKVKCCRKLVPCDSMHKDASNEVAPGIQIEWLHCSHWSQNIIDIF
jgi:hypothetical protein